MLASVTVGNGAAASAQCLYLDHGDTDAIAQEIDVLVDVGLALVGEGDVKGCASHVHCDEAVDVQRLGEKASGHRGRCRAGVDGADGARNHHIARCHAAIGLEVAHGYLGALLTKEGIDAFHIVFQHGAQVGIDHGGGGACVFAHLGVHLQACADVGIGQHLAHDLHGTALVCAIGHRPQERHGNGLNACGLEGLAGRTHILLVQRCAHAAIGQDTLADRHAPLALDQLLDGWVFGVVAVAFFLVAQTDFQ